MTAYQRNKFQYTLDFLKRLNRLEFQGKPLSHQKIFGSYNVWIFFQGRLFFNDIKAPTGFKKTSLSVLVRESIISLLAFLISILGIVIFIFKRPKVIVYSVDKANSSVLSNDARMDSVYQYLKENKISFFEIFHSIFNASLLKNFLKRKRFGLYVKSIDNLLPILRFLGIVKNELRNVDSIDFSSFNHQEREHARSLAERYLKAIDLVKFRVSVLIKVLSWLKPKAIFSIDNTRDYWELLLACRMNNVPFYAFQHGHFTKYHTGWLDDGTFRGTIVSPDKLLVWSKYWKDELIRLGTYFPPSSIEVGGVKEVIPEKGIGSEQDGLTTVLVPFEIDAEKDEVRAYIDALLEDDSIRILFKIRTDADKEDQLKPYKISDNYHPHLKVISDISPYLKEIDVVAGTYSTLLYDMIMFDLPIAIFETALDFGEGLVLNNLADLVHKDNVALQVRKIASTDKSILRARKIRLFGEKPVTMYDTVKRLADKIFE